MEESHKTEWFCEHSEASSEIPFDRAQNQKTPWIAIPGVFCSGLPHSHTKRRAGLGRIKEEVYIMTPRAGTLPDSTQNST